MTQTYPSSKATTAPFIPREASAVGWLRSNSVLVEVKSAAKVGRALFRFLTAQESVRPFPTHALPPGQSCANALGIISSTSLQPPIWVKQAVFIATAFARASGDTQESMLTVAQYRSPT